MTANKDKATKELKMSNDYVIFAPLPQLKVSTKLPNYHLGGDFSIKPLQPQLRRSLLNIAKEQKCSDDCLLLLIESQWVFCAQVPPRDTRVDVFPLNAIFYMNVAEEILKRIFRCLLLFQWVPAPLFIYCWFLAAGSANDINMNTLKMLDPHWEHINLFENIDWRSGKTEPEDITLGLTLLQKYWDKLSEFCQINLLKGILTDKNKEKGIIASANKYVKQKVEELMKAKYGQDAFIVDDESDANPENKDNDNNLPKSKISKSMLAEWFVGGLTEAQLKEMGKLSLEINERVLAKRFDRAFQFFTNAFRLTEPHRFVAFAICLESIFCTSRAEITFQLASRIAWFLHPADYKKRMETFTKAKGLYGLRSEIVHGTNYSSSKINKSEKELISLSRKVFCKVLNNDNIYNIFRHKNQDVCNKYLEGLNLGKINNDKTGDKK